MSTPDAADNPTLRAEGNPPEGRLNLGSPSENSKEVAATRLVSIPKAHARAHRRTGWSTWTVPV